MRVRHLVFGLALAGAGIAGTLAVLPGQETPAPPPGPPAPVAPSAEVPQDVPSGVEVQARGPVHEAFASLVVEPAPTPAIPRRPPAPLEELPPAEKPEGNVTWISGYWAWDDERNDFLWVSGVWRSPPPDKQWVAGYWREEGERWQWVPGFWTAAAPVEQQEAPRQITYLPQPPAVPTTAPPGPAPSPDTFFVPGSWAWNGSSYAWRAGYWARVQPGYVWVPDHYRWTPSGCVWIPGYWDYALGRRGILYAPVVVDPAVVTPRFCYTPAYAVSDAVIVDALFVRPAHAHYYFGDYYGPAYVALGFESGYVYSRRNYDAIVVYEGWEHRATPNWIGIQIDVFAGRRDGRLPAPPRTLVQQNIAINITTAARYNGPVLAPAARVAAARGIRTVRLDDATREQAHVQARAVQQVAQQRTRQELPLPPGSPRQPRVASLSVPKAQAVHPGFVAPRAPSAAAAPPAHVLPAAHSAGPFPQAAGMDPRPGPAAAVPPAHPAGMAPLHPPGSPAASARPPARPAPPPAHRPPPREEHKKE